MINPGKQFEKDFQESALKVMSYIRLNDPASSFNLDCMNCPKKKTRFAARHLCDAIGYKKPFQYFIELKSVKGKAVPFKNIVKNKKDKRLFKMVEENRSHGAKSFVILNFRGADNKTYALEAKHVLNFINDPESEGYPKGRKSIPINWAYSCGLEIRNYKKVVRYKYIIEDLLK